MAAVVAPNVKDTTVARPGHALSKRSQLTCLYIAVSCTPRAAGNEDNGLQYHLELPWTLLIMGLVFPLRKEKLASAVAEVRTCAVAMYIAQLISETCRWFGTSKLILYCM